MGALLLLRQRLPCQLKDFQRPHDPMQIIFVQTSCRSGVHPTQPIWLEDYADLAALTQEVLARYQRFVAGGED